MLGSWSQSLARQFVRWLIVGVSTVLLLALVPGPAVAARAVWKNLVAKSLWSLFAQQFRTILFYGLV